MLAAAAVGSLAGIHIVSPSIQPAQGPQEGGSPQAYCTLQARLSPKGKILCDKNFLSWGKMNVVLQVYLF